MNDTQLPQAGLELIGFGTRTTLEHASRDLGALWGQIMHSPDFSQAPMLWATYYDYDETFDSFSVLVGVEQDALPQHVKTEGLNTVHTGPIESSNMRHLQTAPTPQAVTQTWQEIRDECPRGQDRRGGFDFERWVAQDGVPQSVDIWVGMKTS